MKTRSAFGVLSALALACDLVSPAMVSASAHANAVNVFPAPGTLTASPQTQISFRGGAHGSAAVPVAWAPGRLDVFVVGLDGALWHKWFDGGWSGWESLGGRLIEAPSVAFWAPGRLDVTALGGDRGVWHRPFVSGVGWFDWAPLGGCTNSGTSTAAPAVDQGEVTATGPDGTVWHRSWVGCGTPWALLGGPRSGPTDVFVAGSDGGVGHGVIPL